MKRWQTFDGQIVLTQRGNGSLISSSTHYRSRRAAERYLGKLKPYSPKAPAAAYYNAGHREYWVVEQCVERTWRPVGRFGDTSSPSLVQWLSLTAARTFARDWRKGHRVRTRVQHVQVTVKVTPVPAT